jgi:hypothetical protein
LQRGREVTREGYNRDRFCYRRYAEYGRWNANGADTPRAGRRVGLHIRRGHGRIAGDGNPGVRELARGGNFQV